MYNTQHHIQTTLVQEIFIPVNRQFVKIWCQDIVLVEAADDYVKVHTTLSATPHLIKICLKKAEQLLPPYSFCRVHRSYIVGIRHVKIITRDTVNLGVKEVPLSKNYAGDLRSRFVALATNFHGQSLGPLSDS